MRSRHRVKRHRVKRHRVKRHRVKRQSVVIVGGGFAGLNAANQPRQAPADVTADQDTASSATASSDTASSDTASSDTASSDTASSSSDTAFKRHRVKRHRVSDTASSDTASSDTAFKRHRVTTPRQGAHRSSDTASSDTAFKRHRVKRHRVKRHRVKRHRVKRQSVVIVGGGFAGLNAANQLRKAPADVTVIDRRNHHLFQPLLYQVATGSLSPADISAPIRALLKSQANARVILGEVERIDAADRAVELIDGGRLPYDTLVIASGSGHSYFGRDDWAQAAPALKTLEDAIEIRRRILLAFEAAERATDVDERRAWLTFVVIGGGPTGVEMAGAIGEMARNTLKGNFRSFDPSDARVLLLEGGRRVLPTFIPKLARKAHAALTRLGVEIRTGALVEDADDMSVRVAMSHGAERISARTIVWAAGVQASPLGDLCITLR